MNDRRLFDEMYEMTVSEIMDSKTISLEDKDEFFEEIQLTLMEKFDYVMYGKVFKFSEEANGNITIYASFGGLLFSITGQPNTLTSFEIDERIYLLIKKITK